MINMTERETLLAEKARIDARLAELDKEPDYEAWRPALEAFYAAGNYMGRVGMVFDTPDKENIRGLIAALAKAPPMGSAIMPEWCINMAKLEAVEAGGCAPPILASAKIEGDAR